jgi:hypothetical protein
MGLFAGPLLILSWRRRQGGRGTFILFLLAGTGLGLTLVSCNNPVTGTPTQPPTMPLPPIQPPPTGTPTLPPPTTTPAPITPTPLSTRTPSPTPTITVCPTPTTASPTPTPTPILDTTGWSIRGKQAYYSLLYLRDSEFDTLPWWGKEPEPKELAAWILQAEGSIILGQGQQYMAEGIRFRFDISTCGPGCPPDVAWLSGFTPFILFPESAIPALEAGASLDQFVCRPCLDRLLTEPLERYKQIMYPLFDTPPTYTLLGNPPGIYWWSKEDEFTAPIINYEIPGETSSCFFRARYELATGSYIWFGTQAQFSYAIRGGGRPSECGH